MTFDEALQILQLKQGYTEKELKTNYHKLIKQWHPDLNPSPEAAKNAQELNEAQAILLKNIGGKAKNDIMSFRHKSFFDIVGTRVASGGEFRFRHKSFFDIITI